MHESMAFDGKKKNRKKKWLNIKLLSQFRKSAIFFWIRSHFLSMCQATISSSATQYVQTFDYDEVQKNVFAFM